MKARGHSGINLAPLNNGAEQYQKMLAQQNKRLKNNSVIIQGDNTDQLFSGIQSGGSNIQQSQQYDHAQMSSSLTKFQNRTSFNHANEMSNQNAASMMYQMQSDDMAQHI